MAFAAAKPESRISLQALSVLVVEADPQEQAILDQMLKGFRVKTVTKRTTAASAKVAIEAEAFDLLIVSAALPDTSGHDLIHWLRRNRGQASQTVPALLLAGHTKAADVETARNCGANLIVLKPATSRSLFMRIAWLAKDERPFIETSAYCGPDRRFQMRGPPEGQRGRRKGDLSLSLGDATGNNMSQDDIDAMMNPKRAR